MKISVVIAAYNAAATLGRAIRSVLAQTRPADEIIVVDDGSTDGTAETARQFGSGVRLISQPNGGASVARNTGIQNACGDWIAFLDADDEWLPEKLALQEEWLIKHPDIPWGYSNFVSSNKSSTISGPVLPAISTPDVLFEDYLEAYCRGYFAWTGTILVKREVFSKSGFFLPGMKRGQDTDMWFRIAYQFPRIGYIARPLAIYHLDTPDSSTKRNVHYQYMIDTLDRHLELSRCAGRQQAFLPCAVRMLTNWIRQLIHSGHKKEAEDLFRRYRSYLPGGFIREVQYRLRLPWAGLLIDIYFNMKNKMRKKNRLHNSNGVL